MNTKVLEYCVDIADYRNFTRVSEKNYISQQALSQQIKALEKELGVKLFERTSRTVTVTPAGEAFIEEARLAIEHFNLAVKNARQKGLGLGGTLSIGCNGPTSQLYMSRIIAKFAQKYPQVDIKLKHGTYTEIFKDFSEGKAYDLIEVGEFKDFDARDFNVLRCRSGYIEAVFCKDHPLAAREFVLPQELLKERLIVLSINLPEISARREERLKRILGEYPKKLMQVDNTETINMLVASGMGYTLLNGGLKSTYGFEQFAFVPIKGSQEKHHTYIVSRKDEENSLVSVFLNFAEELAV